MAQIIHMLLGISGYFTCVCCLMVGWTLFDSWEVLWNQERQTVWLFIFLAVLFMLSAAAGMKNKRVPRWLMADAFCSGVWCYFFVYQAPWGVLVQRDIARGGAYWIKGDQNNALDDYSWAIKMDPDNVQARYLRAEIYKSGSELEKALADYTAIINSNKAENKDKSEAYTSRGFIYGIVQDNYIISSRFLIFPLVRPWDINVHFFSFLVIVKFSCGASDNR